MKLVMHQRGAVTLLDTCPTGRNQSLRKATHCKVAIHVIFTPEELQT